MPQAAVQRLSADEFFELDLHDEKAELVSGEVVRMTPAGGEHGIVAMRIGARLLAFVEPAGLGAVCAAETGFLLAREPDLVRAPDAAFVSRQRMGEGPPPKRFWPFAPDLAVEVVSPSESAESIQARVRDWFAGGARRVWVLYPGLAAVHLHRSPGEVRVLGKDDHLTDDELLPGFSCRVGELFV